MSSELDILNVPFKPLLYGDLIYGVDIMHFGYSAGLIAEFSLLGEHQEFQQ